MIKFTPRPFVISNFPLIENALNLFRMAVEAFVRDVNNKPILHGNLIEDQSLGTSWTKYYHKLGRMPKGWIVTKIDGRVAVAQREITSEYIEIRADDTGVTFSIWVF